MIDLLTGNILIIRDESCEIGNVRKKITQHNPSDSNTSMIPRGTPNQSISMTSGGTISRNNQHKLTPLKLFFECSSSVFIARFHVIKFSILML